MINHIQQLALKVLWNLISAAEPSILKKKLLTLFIGLKVSKNNAGKIKLVVNSTKFGKHKSKNLSVST